MFWNSRRVEFLEHADAKERKRLGITVTCSVGYWSLEVCTSLKHNEPRSLTVAPGCLVGNLMRTVLVLFAVQISRHLAATTNSFIRQCRRRRKYAMSFNQTMSFSNIPISSGVNSFTAIQRVSLAARCTSWHHGRTMEFLTGPTGMQLRAATDRHPASHQPSTTMGSCWRSTFRVREHRPLSQLPRYRICRHTAN